LTRAEILPRERPMRGPTNSRDRLISTTVSATLELPDKVGADPASPPGTVWLPHLIVGVIVVVASDVRVIPSILISGSHNDGKEDGPRP
jgi:hypothetical protein